MATTPTTPGFSNPQPAQTTPLPGDPGAQGQSGGQGTGLDQTAPPIFRLLSDWSRVASEIGQHHPPIADKMQKIAGYCREALTTLARAHQGQQQGGGSPTQDAASQQRPTAAGYPPQGTF